jgi:hypothetical protein
MLRLLVATAMLGGCFLSHERDEADLGPAAEWSAITTLFEADAPRPVLQGGEHEVVAVDGGFVVLWMFNRGQIGIGAARIDFDARIVAGPVEVLPAAPPLDRSPQAIAAVGAGRDVVVYWLAEDARVRALSIDARLMPLGEPWVVRDDASERYRGLEIVEGPRERYLAYVRRDAAPVLLPLDMGGDAAREPFTLFERPDREPGFAIGDGGDRADVTWAERTAGGGNDTLWHASVGWDGDDPSAPELLHSADNAIVGPVFRDGGAAWVERSDFGQSFAFRIDDPDVAVRVSDAPNSGSRWTALPDGVAAITGEADEKFTLSTRLVFRRFRSARIVEERTALEDECDIEAYRTAAGDGGALAVSWVDSCGERRLQVRVRRAP